MCEGYISRGSCHGVCTGKKGQSSSKAVQYAMRGEERGLQHRTVPTRSNDVAGYGGGKSTESIGGNKRAGDSFGRRLAQGNHTGAAAPRTWLSAHSAKVLPYRIGYPGCGSVSVRCMSTMRERGESSKELLHKLDIIFTTHMSSANPCTDLDQVNVLGNRLAAAVSAGKGIGKGIGDGIGMKDGGIVSVTAAVEVLWKLDQMGANTGRFIKKLEPTLLQQLMSLSSSEVVKVYYSSLHFFVYTSIDLSSEERYIP